MAAVIGSLRAILGLDSAEFANGLKKANAGLNGFVKTAGAGFALVATAATAAGVALGVAVKGAIDNADQMGEMAQKIGVSVEALSSLSYAAKLSGTDTETLSTGLRKLSQNMLAVAQGAKGPVATAFNALGISVKNADGSLRASDEVLLEIAQKFGALEDGTTKTALAMQLFGKSGAELVPFLSQGKDGIAALQAEADRLGITLNSSTAAAAGEFNDSLDRLKAGLQGMVNRITQAALPALNSLVGTLTSPDFQSAMKDFAIACIRIADGIAQVFIGAHKAFQDFMAFIKADDGGINGARRDPGVGLSDIFPAEYGAAEGDIRRQMEFAWRHGTPLGGGADPYAGFGLNSDGTIKVLETKTAVQELIASFDGLFTSSGAASGGVSTLKQAMLEGREVFAATRTPTEAYALEVERLNGLLQKGAIDQDTYNRAVLQAQDAFAKAESSGSQLASTLASGLANVFNSVIDGSKSAVEAVGDLMKSLGQMAMQAGFKALLGGLMGGISIPGFANGTNFAPGGLALVGERGPELVNLPRGSQVIPNHALRSGGGLTVHVDARGAQVGVAEQLDQWARFRLPALVNQITSDPLARG